MSAPKNPQLNIQQISDLYVRANFQALQTWFDTNNQLVGFKFFEINENAAVTGKTYGHNLGLVPKDVLVTKVTGSGLLTWNYAEFDTKNLNYSTTGAVRVRGFAGTWPGDTSILPQSLTQGLLATPETQGDLVSPTTSYAMKGTESVVLMSPSLPAVVTLAAVSSPVFIKNLSGNSVTIRPPQGSNGLLDGKTSFVLGAKNASATVAYLAPNWYIVANYPG